jgi:Tfp pilus assembly protein PilN
LVTLLITILSLISLTAYEWYAHTPDSINPHLQQKTQKQIFELSQALEGYKKEEEISTKKMHTVSSSPASHLTQYIEKLISAMPETSCLYYLSCNKKQQRMELKGYTESIPSLQQWCNHLTGSDAFKQVTITSLTPHTAHDASLYAFIMQVTLQPNTNTIQ